MSTHRSIRFTFVALAALVALGCGPAQSAIVTTPAPGPGEFGRALAGAEAATHIATFDALDFEVFSHQDWTRLHESHAHDIIVSWPDGHDAVGIDTHIHDLEQLFIHAPDTAISIHPVRIASGDWTAVTGIMTGTFTQPMPTPDGGSIPPTGHHFSLPMATIAHWTNGTMDHEWLYWDNQTYMHQLGL